MNLISCDNCAIVLDKDKLAFYDEEHFYDEMGEIDEEKAVWSYDHDRYVAYTSCPVCGENILEE